MTRSASLFVLGLAAWGCGGERHPLDATVGTSKPESPHVAPGAGSSPVPAASEAIPTSTPSAASQAPSAPPPELRQPEIAQAFLPHEAACTADSDCAATRFGVGPRFTCCDPCDAAAGTRAWVKRADARCEAMHRANQVGVCPPRDCASLGAKCVSGQCVPAVP